MHKASTLFQILNVAFSLEIFLKIEPLRLEIKVLCIQFKTYFLFSSNTEFDAPQNLLILMLIQALIFIFHNEKSPPMVNFPISDSISDIV